MGIEEKGWGVSTSKKFILKVLCKADKVDYKGDEEDWNWIVLIYWIF